MRRGRARPSIGFLSTYSVYEGTSIDSYAHALLQGICAAAREHDCNLLLGCGISLPGSPRASRTVWAVPGAGVDFVPIGPWNTDGLIIVPDDLSDAQFEYVQALMRSGYPVVLTTAEKPGPIIAVDNAGGIRQAFDHLWQHGQDVANPIATILTGAMLLRYSLGLETEAQAIEDAVGAVLAEGYRTKDILEEGAKLIGTREMGDRIAAKIEA